jgi:hypothetical protein
MLSLAGLVLFALSLLMGGVYLVSRLLFPNAAPKGFTTLALTVTFFGSINILAVSVIGEYIAKIFEEVKRRPHFVRRNFIRDGEIRAAPETGDVSMVQSSQND